MESVKSSNQTIARTGTCRLTIAHVQECAAYSSMGYQRILQEIPEIVLVSLRTFIDQSHSTICRWYVHASTYTSQHQIWLQSSVASRCINLLLKRFLRSNVAPYYILLVLKQRLFWQGRSGSSEQRFWKSKDMQNEMQYKRWSLTKAIWKEAVWRVNFLLYPHGIHTWTWCKKKGSMK